ncbi:hypothetical protein [Terrabacter sp. NPDC080008]|uniref:hypothetical protein n=1 Tax=Terrabacter sp. NPDC080008 TaxID=3155176 RepID=UPI00344DE922
MRTLSLVLRRATLVLTTIFAVGGLLFALGYAFDDPGGWAAVLMALGVVVPTAALTLLAVFRRRLAGRVLAVAVALFAAWGVVNFVVDLVEAPDVPVLTLMLALPLAVVGLTYPLRAGGLLLAVAAVPFLSVLVRLLREPGAEGPGLGALLGGSSGAVVAPLVGLAALLLLAAAVDRREPGAGTRRTQPDPPRTVPPRGWSG